MSVGGTCADELEKPGVLSRYLPSLQGSRLALLKCAPRTCGWWRTRWRCATLAAEVKVRRGVTVSQEKVRRWLPELDYLWKRAPHAAPDNDPERISKVARIRHIVEHLRPSEVLFFSDELDIHLLDEDWLLCGCSKALRLK